MSSAASTLAKAGFAAPSGYFSGEEEAEICGDAKEGPRRWIGRERNTIIRAARFGGFWRVVPFAATLLYQISDVNVLYLRYNGVRK
jgi:hypothetical protein